MQSYSNLYLIVSGIDSGCGTGTSTLAIAAAHPNIVVIGIDRSIVRLSKNSAFKARHNSCLSNHVFVRADLVDFFLLALENRKWIFHSHYILYPNPYPKSKHLGRRFHGNPVFPVMLALGGKLFLRSNWFVYAMEMKLAIDAIASKATSLKFESAPIVMPHIALTPITNFERKYSQIRMPLYEFRADLGARGYTERMRMIYALNKEVDLGDLIGPETES